MDDNPLSALPSGSGGGGPTDLRASQWDVGELLAEAWEITKANLAPLIGVGVLYFVVIMALNFAGSFVGGIIGGAAGDQDPNMVTGAVAFVNCCSTLVNSAVQAFLQVGLIRFGLAVARREQADFGAIFSGGDRVISLFLANLLVGLATVLGTLCFIVPGIILALGLSFTAYFVSDTRLGIIESITASWRVTDGHKMNIFLLGLAIFGLTIVGMIPCGLGLFVTAPLSGIAYCVLYRRLTGRDTTGMGDPMIA